MYAAIRYLVLTGFWLRECHIRLAAALSFSFSSWYVYVNSLERATTVYTTQIQLLLILNTTTHNRQSLQQTEFVRESNNCVYHSDTQPHTTDRV